MIVAFGQYSKLFKYLKKTPKTYKAVVWLGAQSESFDIEKVISVDLVEKINEEDIKSQLNSLVGELEYIPPKFSAKKIDGVRAYELARQGHDVELDKCKMNIYNTKFISYRHPFITFETTVSEGSYIRSFAQILLEKLGTVGTLSYLERINEGSFFYDNEKDLNPLDYIDLPINNYYGTTEWLNTGKKISIDYLEQKENGKYLIITDKFFSIIEIEEGEVKYLLNKVLKV